MNELKKKSIRKAETMKWALIVSVGALAALVLMLAIFDRSGIVRRRDAGGYTTVENMTVTQSDGQVECRFTPRLLEHDGVMSFFINHHEVTVYVGDECVYELTASQGGSFVTVGGVWVTVPLYEGDAGKEIRLVLHPLYDDYAAVPEVYIGSEIAVHDATLHRAMPALILSLYVMFVGVLLLCLVIYHGVKGLFNGRLYSLALLALFAGLWRASYDRTIYLLLEPYAVAIYTVSIVSLMAVALSMLNCLQTSEKTAGFVRVATGCYCVVYIVQLLLQALGVADLRQTLKVIHATIVISALVFMIDGVRRCFRPREKAHRRADFGWMLSVGVLMDLLLYYVAASSLSMVCTLVAILCYCVLEGVGQLFFYVEQSRALEEMKKDLALSRTTTMMSQIRSHFVFNVLNAISGMCKYDPQKADETVVRFARYLRANIDIMENDASIPFSTDLRQLEDYVALERVRFGDKIEFYTDIETVDFAIPPLILQPVVENAIKHGVSKKQGNGSIILRTRDEGGRIVITVEDDGVGFDVTVPEKETSVGLRNIRFRLEHLVGGTLDIQSEPGRGTTVTITIPKEGE